MGDDGLALHSGGLLGCSDFDTWPPAGKERRVLRVHELSVRFQTGGRSVLALDRISFNLERGESLALIRACLGPHPGAQLAMINACAGEP
jgi:hypothetical protein